MSEVLVDGVPEESKGSRTWEKVMKAALALPGAKVDRIEFLRSQLTNYCDEVQVEKALEENENPASAGISPDLIDKLADSCIRSHVLQASLLSFGTGVWGGWAMAVSVPADLAQFYWHAIVLSQKLAYLYGWPDVLEEGEVDEETLMRITLLIGVMLGAHQAGQVAKEISKRLSQQAVRRIPRYVLTKTSYFPLIKQVGRWIGISITKNTFARGIGRIIPVMGGFISAGITKVMMQSMADKLQSHLKTLKFAQQDEKIGKE